MRPALLALLVVLGLTSCARDEEQVRLAGGTMGTTWSVNLTGIGDRQADRMHADIMVLLDEINAAMSTWDPNSEISRFNQMEAGCMQISPAFAGVVRAALEISTATRGAYDITLGPLIDLWGFGAEQEIERPARADVEAVLGVTGYRHLQLENQRLCKDMDEVQINLSSIAKGYAVDRVAEYLADVGLHNALVEIGGELMAMGANRGAPWRIGIENPTESGPRAVFALPLVDRAVATSGDYRNYFVMDGERFSHIIDPRTGGPVANGVASVTLVADRVMMADGWATALMVLPPQNALELADEQGLSALILVRTETGFSSLQSDNWQAEFDIP